MIVYDKEQKEIVIPNGIGNINLFNNGVEAGYNQGKIDGIDEQKSKLESINITENGTYDKEDGYNHIEVNVPDLNGSYDEGYEQGHTEGYNEGYTEGEGVGYNQGKTDGINEQKGKLSQITISENGTYAKEDGYNKVIVNVPDLNGSYDEGYAEGQADLAAKARVLEVTENGVYKSKFSDPIVPDTVTGVYDNGTNFYSYAELNGKVFNTKIAATVDSRLEFWYKGDNTSVGFGDNVIIGAGDNDDNNYFQVRYYEGFNGWVKISVGNSTIDINNWNDRVWHHLIISKAEGLWIDGEKKGDFTASNTINGEFFINGIGYDTARNANGTFGMIKIDDTTIIPTAEGFKNVNTGKLLEAVKDGAYTFTENLPIYAEGELYKTINVNVPDLNGSYDEGYEQGKTEGEQEGYEQGQADLVAKARVLNVTENGVYKSKYSDPIVPDTYTVTGVYADGTNFYSYAELNGKVFNTKIAGSADSRLEFWYKGDNTSAGSGLNVIMGSGDYANNAFEIKYHITNNDILLMDIGTSPISVSNWNDTVWHHLIISKAEGIWIDGEKKRDFSPTTAIKGELLINGVSYDTDGTRNANGCFGMIKINDVIIIPTADGFLNTNTGELLEVVKDGGYNFTENLPTYPEGEGELYKTINVNIDVDSYYNNGYNQGKTDGVNEQKSKLETISITENGTYDREDGYNHIEVNVPDLNGSYDEGYNQGHTEGYNEGKTDGVNEQKGKLTQITISENGTYTKEDGYNKVVVEVPDLNGSYDEGYNQGKIDGANEQKSKLETINITENGTYRKEDGYNEIVVEVPGSSGIPKINVKEAGLKLGYSSFIEVPEWVDFKGVTDMSYMFYSCIWLQTIPFIDTSNVTSMNYMLQNCSNLQTIPSIDTSNVTTMPSIFYNCKSLVSLPSFNAQSLDMPPYFSIFGNYELPKLTDFGGFLNLKCSLANNGDLKKLPNLTYESCINVLNGLYDFTGNGETPNSNQGKLKVHQNFLDKVGDKISIGTAKGWVISA